MASDFWGRGLQVVRGFLDWDECDRLLGAVAAYRATHDLPLVHRQVKGRSLHYMVIDGSRVGDAVPGLPELLARVQAKLGEITGRELVPIDDRLAAVNVNVTPPGGEYRWHYDRNAVSALLYLNEVAGGETELYPNHRLVFVQGRFRRLQELLDRLVRWRPVLRAFGHRTEFAPERGSLLVMRGNRTLHSVRRVEGDRDRVNIVLAYDEPGAPSSRPGLDSYLYTSGPYGGADPNYRP